MQHILIVEDDLDIQELLKNFLQEVGYAVTLASDGIEAISLFASTHFDLILLDIMLPKIDGFTVCELIRKQSRVPIIMLTALNGEEEQIRGLDLQVDDYITKPFSMPILVRKIGAVLRRSSMIPEQEHQTITYKNLVLDMDSYDAVQKSTLQQRRWQKGSGGGADLLWPGNDEPYIYILVSGKERFKYAQQEQPQPYALCVTFAYESEENIDLYNQLRNNVKLKVTERVKTRVRV